MKGNRLVLGLVFVAACSGRDAVGGLSGGEGNGSGAMDAGTSRPDFGGPPSLDLGGPPGRDAGPVDGGVAEPGEELTCLCSANCRLVGCADPTGTAEQLCREGCGQPLPGVDPEAPGCSEATEALAACLEDVACDELQPGICEAEQERFLLSCLDATPPPPPPEVPPELARFCDATCELTDRCVFPAPGCRDACLQGFEQGDLEARACVRALDNATQCLEGVECRELLGGEPPCQVAIGLVQFACQ